MKKLFFILILFCSLNYAEDRFDVVLLGPEPRQSAGLGKINSTIREYLSKTLRLKCITDCKQANFPTNVFFYSHGLCDDSRVYWRKDWFT